MQLQKLMPLAMRLTRSSLAVGLIIALGSCLGACVTDQTGSPAINSIPCQSMDPIHWSHKDTPETVRQSVDNNAVGAKLCATPNWKTGK